MRDPGVVPQALHAHQRLGVVLAMHRPYQPLARDADLFEYLFVERQSAQWRRRLIEGFADAAGPFDLVFAGLATVARQPGGQLRVLCEGLRRDALMAVIAQAIDGLANAFRIARDLSAVGDLHQPGRRRWV